MPNRSWSTRSTRRRRSCAESPQDKRYRMVWRLVLSPRRVREVLTVKILLFLWARFRITRPARGFFTWILGILAAVVAVEVVATLRLRGFSFPYSVCFGNGNTPESVAFRSLGYRSLAISFSVRCQQFACITRVFFSVLLPRWNPT